MKSGAMMKIAVFFVMLLCLTAIQAQAQTSLQVTPANLGTLTLPVGGTQTYQVIIGDATQGESIDWTAVVSQGFDWIDIRVIDTVPPTMPVNEQLEGTADPISIMELTVDTTGMSPGTYPGSVTISPNNLGDFGPATTVTLTLTVSPFDLRVTPASIGPITIADGASKSFIVNVGNPNPTKEVRWKAAASANWITVASDGQTAAGSTTPVVITLNPAPGGSALPPATYSGTVTFTPTDPDDGPSVTVTVYMTISQSGLEVSPAQIGPVTISDGREQRYSVVLRNNTSSTPIGWTSIVSSSDNPQWITVTDSLTGTANGTANPTSTVLITLNPQNLSPSADPYTGFVTFVPTTPNSGPPVTVNVTLIVPFPESLQVAPSGGITLTMSEATPYTTMWSVWHANPDVSVNWTAYAGADWIKVGDPPNSETPGASAPSSPLLVTILPGNLPPGTHNDVVIVAPDDAYYGPPLSIPVSVTIPSPTELQVSPQNIGPLSLLDNATYVAQVWNPNAIPVKWNAIATASWLTIDNDTSDSVAPGTETEGTTSASWPLYITVNAQNPTVLPPGDYTGYIIVSPEDPRYGLPVTITVDLTVPKPESIQATPTTISAAIADNLVRVYPVLISNPNSTAMGWKASSDSKWLQVDNETPSDPPVSPGGRETEDTTKPMSTSTLWLYLDPEELSAGTYEGTVIIMPDNPNYGPAVTINVTLTVSAYALQVTPGSIGPVTIADDLPRTQTITLRNPNSQNAIDWTGTTSASWIRLASTKGVVAANSTVSNIVTINPVGLLPETYSGFVTITPLNPDYGPPLTVNVTLIITGVELQVTPDTIDITTANIEQYLVIVGNPGSTDAINWGAAASSEWIKVDNDAAGSPAVTTSGIASPTSPLYITIDPRNLLPGDYKGVVTITPDDPYYGTPVVVSIDLTVPSPNSIQATPTTITTTIADNGTRVYPVLISNPNSTPVGWKAFSDSEWLEVDNRTPSDPPVLPGTMETGGTAVTTSNLWLYLNPGNLSAGTYEGKVIIMPDDINYGPAVTINVTLTVSTLALQVTPGSIGPFTIPANTTRTFNVTVGNPNSIYPISWTAITSAQWIEVSDIKGVSNPLYSLEVIVNTQDMPPGDYTGTVTVIPDNTAYGPPILINVEVTVSETTLQVNPTVIGPVTVVPASGEKYIVPVFVQSSNFTVDIAWKAIAIPSSSWIQLSQDNGTTTTGTGFNVTLDPSSPNMLNPGTYQGSVIVSPPSESFGPPVTIQITMEVPEPTETTFPVAFESSTYMVDENAGTALIKVIRSGSAAGEATVNYTTSDGTATAGLDYTPAAGVLTFASGQSEATFIVPILEDSIEEGYETLRLTLTNPTGWAVLGVNSTTVVTITDNDKAGELRFDNATFSVNEDAGSALITVRRVNGSDGSVAVQYATSEGTATKDVDYVHMVGILTFAQGETSKTFMVPIIDEDQSEGDETVNLILSSPTGGAVLGTPNKAVLTIVDAVGPGSDKPGQLQFDSAAYQVDENVTEKTVTVIRTNGSDGSVTVQYETSDGTATVSVDYRKAEGTLTFGPGETSKTFTVLIIDDLIEEGPETVKLTLKNPTGGATLGTTDSTVPPGTATLTILDQDQAGQFRFSSAAYSAVEGSGSLMVTVNRVNGSTGSATVEYSTSDGTAVQGFDYRSTSGTLFFANGETSKVVYVPIIDNKITESDKTLKITLKSPTAASLGSPTTATLTITNDDRTGKLEFSAIQYSVNEDGNNITVAVVRIDGNDGSVEVQYDTSDGTATKSVDYEPASGTLTFGDGEVRKEFLVYILNDADSEQDETVKLTLSNPTGGAALGDVGTSEIIIKDNDGSVPSSGSGQLQFTTSTYQVNQDAVNVAVAVTRTDGRDGTVAVDYVLNDKTESQDLNSISSVETLTFEEGETTKALKISLPEKGSGDLVLNLSSPAGGANLGNPSTATLTVVDSSLLSVETPLNAGWNLISFPVVPSNPAIESVLKPIAGSYSVVWKFSEGQWQRYDPENPSSSNLNTIEADCGYWIKMKEPRTLNFRKEIDPGPMDVKSVYLKPGWNLVGFGGLKPALVNDALASVANQVDIVWCYRDGRWFMYDPQFPMLNDLTELIPGQGYWIKVSGACTWVLP